MREAAKALLQRIRIARQVPPRLRTRWSTPGAEGLSRVEHALRTEYFSQPLNNMGLGEAVYLASEEGRQDLSSHLAGRLEGDRHDVVPWLESMQSLAGRTVLEIGCGTGSSTVALAEQGAVVTGLDINAGNIAVAQARCAAHRVDAAFVCSNATGIGERFERDSFDLVIFFATLEHLTYAERIPALRMAWSLVRPGGLLAVFEAPNRLWWFDPHTSDLPFYHWLPDELAIPYSSWSPRESLRSLYGGRFDPDAETELDFSRRGRGVSYHEFELAIAELSELDVAGDLLSWLRRKDPLLAVRWRFSRNGRYQRMLKSLQSRVPDAFLESGISLALRKRPLVSA